MLDRIDVIAKRLSVRLARASSRRDFLSKGAQALVAVGLGAWGFFGAGKAAFATGCAQIPGQECLLYSFCCSSTALDCGGSPPGPYIPTCICDGCACQDCPSGWELITAPYTYVCCCNGFVNRCSECTQTVMGNPSFCVFTQVGDSC